MAWVASVAARQVDERILEDELTANRHGQRAVFAERLRAEQDPVADRAVTVVAEQGRVVSVVRDDPHSPVVRHLADPEEPYRRDPVEVHPARLDIAESVVRVARRLIGGRIVGHVSGDHAGDEIELGDEEDVLPELEARGEAEPVIEPRVLAERVGGRAGVGEQDAVTDVEREALHPVETELVFAVEAEANEPFFGGEERDAAVLDREAREVGRVVRSDVRGDRGLRLRGLWRRGELGSARAGEGAKAAKVVTAETTRAAGGRKGVAD